MRARRFPLITVFKHVTGCAVAWLVSIGVIWVLEVGVTPFTTWLALLLREIASILLVFGPGLLVTWIFATIYERSKKQAMQEGLPVPVTSWPLTITTWTTIILTFSICYTLALRAFPGPWHSND